MKIECFPVGSLDTNCYLVTCEETGDSVLIDPGGFPGELFRPGRDLRLRAILLTHGHFDHMGGAEEVRGRTGAPVMIHAADAPILGSPDENGSALFGFDPVVLTPDVLLSGGQTVEFGECSFDVFHTPGHTRGGISFRCGKEGVVFAGDVLFRLSVGRWDLPGGDYSALVRTIDTVFRPMPDETVVYPGHGDMTTIGYERRHNRFLAE